jgi:hypothetical protein
MSIKGQAAADTTVLADMARTRVGLNGRSKCRGGQRGRHGPMADLGGHVYQCMGCSGTADVSDEAAEYQQSRRTPSGGAVRAVQTGQPIREFGARQPRTRQSRRRRRWFSGWWLVLAALIAAGLMGARAWDAAPVDGTGCPAAASVQECPR